MELYSVTFVEIIREVKTDQSITNVKGRVRCGPRRRCGQALVKTGISVNEGGRIGFGIVAGISSVVVSYRHPLA
jgi:hypothetical protein